MHFGATLRLLRRDAGLSLRSLATRIGVSSAYLSRVEHGLDAIPTPERLDAIAGALGLPPALLIELAHRVEPFVARSLDDVPAAGALFLEIAQRRLTGPEVARVKAFVEREFPERAGTAPARTTRLVPLLTPDRVVQKLECSELEDAIDVAASRIAATTGAFDAHALAAEMIAREREGPSAIGHGFVVPHVVRGGAQDVAAVVTLATPLRDVDTPDGAPLVVLVALVLGGDVPSQLAHLAQVARLASEETTLCLQRARDGAGVVRALAERENMFS
jgi:PTS system nitrogen regulatory IIA component